MHANSGATGETALGLTLRGNLLPDITLRISPY